jgi:hypothetical protein
MIGHFEHFFKVNQQIRRLLAQPFRTLLQRFTGVAKNIFR